MAFKSSKTCLKAWPVTKGSPNIRINICDDGIDRNHSEFVSKIVGEYDFEVKYC